MRTLSSEAAEARRMIGGICVIPNLKATGSGYLSVPMSTYTINGQIHVLSYREADPKFVDSTTGASLIHIRGLYV